MSVLQPIRRRPESVTDQVYRAIREAIVSHEMKPGERIVEATVAERLGVSKTPVREALLRLMNVGLVEVDGMNRGGRVVTPTLETVRSAFEVRTALEVQCSRIVAERGAADDVAEARKLAESCLGRAELGDQEGFRDLDRSFHFSLIDATGNDALRHLTAGAFDLTWTLRVRGASGRAGALACAREHLAITEAIENGDPDSAAAAMRAHIVTVEDLVLAAYRSMV